MSKNKVEFIDRSEYAKCYTCSGEKLVFSWENYKGKLQQVFTKCPTCKGTGLFKEESYIMVVETPLGEKIAFQVDSIK